MLSIHYSFGDIICWHYYILSFTEDVIMDNVNYYLQDGNASYYKVIAVLIVELVNVHVLKEHNY